MQLTLAGGSIYPLPGKIIFADRQVNVQTGTIQIVGEFPNSRNLLRPGQYARVQAPTGKITGALLVPQAAVSQQQGAWEMMALLAPIRAAGSAPSKSGQRLVNSGSSPRASSPENA